MKILNEGMGLKEWGIGRGIPLPFGAGSGEYLSPEFYKISWSQNAYFGAFSSPSDKCTKTKKI